MWHHFDLTVHYDTVTAHTGTYDRLYIDGNKIFNNLNLSFGGQSGQSGTFAGVQMQMDGTSSTSRVRPGNQISVDNMTVSFW